MSQFRRTSFGSGLRRIWQGSGRPVKPLRAPIQGSTLANGLVAYYTLSDVNDSTGNGRTLTNVDGGSGPVTFVAGKVGNCARFVWTALHYLTRADNAFRFTGDFTVGAWIKIASNSGGTQAILDCGEIDVDGWSLIYDSFNTDLRVQVRNGSVVQAIWDNPTLSAWHLVIAWLDTAAQQLGIVLDNGTPVTAACTIVPAMSTDNFSVGARSTDQSIWDGDIDEAFIYNRPLTAAERTSLYNGDNGMTWPLG